MRMSGARIASGAPSTARLRRDLREFFERGDEFRPAIGIAGIVDGVDADVDFAGAEHFGPPERDRQHDRVARGDVRDRNAARRFGRHRERAVGQRGTADVREVDEDRAVLACAERARDRGGRVELGSVALSIRDRERVALETGIACERQHGCGIDSAGEQNYCASSQLRILVHTIYLPGTLPQSTLCSCIWKRTGSRSARIQSASIRGSSCPALGLNSTVQTAGRHSSANFARLHS